MDFAMPYAQKQAWNKVKEAIDNYAELTGSDIAVVTKFSKTSQLPGAGDGPSSSKSSLAIHGHGNLLLQVRQYMEQLRNQLEYHSNGENGAGSQITIPTPHKNADHHSQSIARSLTSSFQSLKLDSGSRAAKPGFSFHESQRREKSSKRTPAQTPQNRDLTELNENLLFEESSDEDRQESSDSESGDDFDSDGYSPHYGRGNTIARPQVNHFQHDPSRAGTSLPVTINMNYRMKPELKPNFPQMKYQSGISRPQDYVDDTPNPAKMMASIQALARSVHEDTSQIFGERPRPNVAPPKYM